MIDAGNDKNNNSPDKNSWMLKKGAVPGSTDSIPISPLVLAVSNKNCTSTVDGILFKGEKPPPKSVLWRFVEYESSMPSQYYPIVHVDNKK